MNGFFVVTVLKLLVLTSDLYTALDFFSTSSILQIISFSCFFVFTYLLFFSHSVSNELSGVTQRWLLNPINQRLFVLLAVAGDPKDIILSVTVLNPKLFVWDVSLKAPAKDEWFFGIQL